jgi:hypothetical protein
MLQPKTLLEMQQRIAGLYQCNVGEVAISGDGRFRIRGLLVRMQRVVIDPDGTYRLETT